MTEGFDIKIHIVIIPSLLNFEILVNHLKLPPPSSFLSKVSDALRKNFRTSKKIELTKKMCLLKFKTKDREVTQEEAKPKIFLKCARNAKIRRRRAGISGFKVSQNDV